MRFNFQELVLDDELVKQSYVVIIGNLYRKIYLTEIPYDTKSNILKSDADLAKDLVDKKIEVLF